MTQTKLGKKPVTENSDVVFVPKRIWEQEANSRSKETICYWKRRNNANRV